MIILISRRRAFVLSKTSLSRLLFLSTPYWPWRKTARLEMALELGEGPFLFRLARIWLYSACILRTGVRLNSKVMVNIFAEGSFKTGAFKTGWLMATLQCSLFRSIKRGDKNRSEEQKKKKKVQLSKKRS